MKTLVVYYSRTRVTKKVSDFLAEKLGAQVEELQDTVDRAGLKGYMLSGRDATLKRLTQLQPVKFNPADFDLVLIGSPIWSWNLSTPIRTYLTEHKPALRKVAFFCTMGGSGDERAAAEVEKILGRKLLAKAGLLTSRVVKNEFEGKAEKFLAELVK
jgi:menaquinone-dependent protoporphyrinogen IX oxidase